MEKWPMFYGKKSYDLEEEINTLKETYVIL